MRRPWLYLLLSGTLVSCAVQTVPLEGSEGPQGETGPRGQPGVPGETGLQGPTGVAGETGLQGVPGVSPFTKNADGSIFYNDGNVGLGTSSPASLLELHATNPKVNLTCDGSELESEPGLILDASSAGGRAYQILAGGSESSHAPGQFVVLDSTASAERIVLDADGNMGVGVTTPLDRLHVGGNARFDGALSSAKRRVQRDFFTWTTNAGGSTPVHIKTNLPVQSGEMYRFVVEGYAHAMNAPLYCEAVGYMSALSPCTYNDKVYNRDPSVAVLSQYCSQDGFLVLRLSVPDMYYVGFAMSAWFVNPTGTFDISAIALQQQNDL